MQVIMMVSSAAMAIMLLVQFKSYGLHPQAQHADTTQTKNRVIVQTSCVTEIQS